MIANNLSDRLSQLANHLFSYIKQPYRRLFSDYSNKSIKRKEVTSLGKLTTIALTRTKNLTIVGRELDARKQLKKSLACRQDDLQALFKALRLIPLKKLK